MAPNPIATLKKGLLKKIKAHKDKLIDTLVKNKKLSDDDKQWLDYEANKVDEQIVLDIVYAL